MSKSSAKKISKQDNNEFIYEDIDMNSLQNEDKLYNVESKNESTEFLFDGEVLNKFMTVTAKIRYLNFKGLSRSAISKKLNISYQQVRNTLLTPALKPKENYQIN